MKEINHFMLPEHTNKLYSEEAISSISLTRDVADKINELVDAYNELNKEDLLWKQEQEGRIRKGVLYMKDNLLNSLNDLMVLLRDSGFIDDRIDYHCKNLQLQIDNLLTAETVDNELIDLRVANGVQYTSAGESFRNSLLNVIKQAIEYVNLSENNDAVYTPFFSGYIDNDLRMHSPSKNKEITTEYIPIGDKDIYRLSLTFEKPSNQVYWIGVTYYDSDKIALSRTSEENITEKIIINNVEGAAYFRVSVRTFGNASLLIHKKRLDEISKEVPIYNHKYNYEYLKLNFSLGYYNGAGDIINPTPHGVEMCSELVPVLAGDKYALIINAENKEGIVGNHAGYLWGAVAFFDADGNFMYRPYSYTETKESPDCKYSIVGEFMIPAGVAFIKVMGRTYWNGSINLALKKDLINSTTASVTFENACSHVKGIAHRGYSATTPENTLIAYKTAKKKNFFYVECDVRFTSDGVPVLLHDATVDRTSNGTGNIDSMTFEQVRKLDFGSWFSKEFEGTIIPTFEEFIILCKKLGLHPYIELKAGTEEQIHGLIDIVRKYGLIDNVTWIGGSPYNTYIVPVYNKARIGLVVSNVTSAVVNEAKRHLSGENEVFLNSNSYTDEEVELCQSNGIGLEVWTINNEEEIANLPAYVGGVTSDYLHAGIVSFEHNIN